MRVKVRFDAESSQAPVVLDLRFLPRVGEKLEIGFRRVIEVLDVRRIDSDNRIDGIIRGKLLRVERRAPLNPAPAYQAMTLPLPDWRMQVAPAAVPKPAPAPPPVLVSEPEPAPVVPEAPPASFGDLNFADLAAALQGNPPSPQPI